MAWHYGRQYNIIIHILLVRNVWPPKLYNDNYMKELLYAQITN